MAETPVETIRRAATKMRERAEASQQWLADQPRDWWSPKVLVEAFTAWTGEEPGQVIWGVDKDAEHLASWHPAVALAVADWLDFTARGMELAEEYGGSVPHADDHALTVARTYLGEVTA